MAYGNFNDSARRTASCKYYIIKHLIFLKIQNMMDITEVLLQWFINYLIKKISDNGFEMENMSDRHLTEELHKSVIKNFKKRKVQSPFIDNI